MLFLIRYLYNSRSGKKRDIALKELILGFQDLPVESIEEFLIEIKYMRYG